MANPISSILILLLAMLSIQSGAALAKQLFPIFGPEVTTMLRVGFSALLLGAIWKPWRLRLDKKSAWSIVFYGLSLGLMNLTFYISLKRIPLGVAVALEFTGPLAIALFSSRRPLDFVWALLAALGIYWMSPFAEASKDLDPVGVLFALIAGGFWALYIVFGKKTGKAVAGGNAAAAGMAFAAIAVLPFGMTHIPDMSFSVVNIALAFGVAILSSAIPYSLEMIALRNIPTKTFGVLMSMEPALACVSGLVFLGEVLQPMQWLAIACVVIASAGSSR